MTKTNRNVEDVKWRWKRLSIWSFQEEEEPVEEEQELVVPKDDEVEEVDEDVEEEEESIVVKSEVTPEEVGRPDTPDIKAPDVRTEPGSYEGPQ